MHNERSARVALSQGVQQGLDLDGTTPPSFAQPKARHREYCQHLLSRGWLNPWDEAYLAELLERHPHADEKIGVGIAGIGVQTVPGYRTRGFYVQRIDGTRTDFSYRQCLTPSTPRADVIQAMRLAIADQIIAFKIARFDGRCEVTGEPLDWHDADIDHAEPLFKDIADAFADLYGGYEHITLLPSIDNGIGQELHPDITAHFQAFHRDRAVLRIVSKPTNQMLYQERRRER